MESGWQVSPEQAGIVCGLIWMAIFVAFSLFLMHVMNDEGLP